MKKAISLVLTLSMMITMLAACGSDTADSTTPSTDSGSTDSNTSSGITGDNVVVSDDIEVDFSQEPEGVVAGTAATISSDTDFASQLLPYTYNGGRHFYSYVYDSLFWDENNDGDSSTPLLVESYTVSEDGSTWVLNLYEDIYFHNGNNLTAASVVGSFDFYAEYNLTTAMNDIASYEATDEYQVTFVLDDIGAETPNFLGIFIFDYTSYEELGYTADAGIGAGSGPYEIVSYSIGDNVVLKAVEDLWHDTRQAHIETVTMEIITNANTIYSAIAAGDIQYAKITDYSSYELLSMSDEHVIVTQDGTPCVIWMNATGFCDYLGNAVVREALSMLIDDEQVMLAATGGYGIVNSNPLNSNFSDYYTHDRIYDPEAAIAMIEAEGIAPEDIELIAITDTANAAAFTNIQAQLMEYGITLNFTASDMNVVMTVGTAGEWDLWNNTGGLSDVKLYTVGVNNILSHDAAQVIVTDPELKIEVADMIAEAVTTLDINEFYDILADVCQTLDENYVYLCSWQGVIWNVFTSNIVNPVVDSSLTQWRIYESWIAE